MKCLQENKQAEGPPRTATSSYSICSLTWASSSWLSRVCKTSLVLLPAKLQKVHLHVYTPMWDAEGPGCQWWHLAFFRHPSSPRTLGFGLFVAFLIVPWLFWQQVWFLIFKPAVTCWRCNCFRNCWHRRLCKLLTGKLRAIKRNYTL